MQEHLSRSLVVVGASLLLGFIETYGVALTSASWSSILLYGVFLLALFLRPEGILTARQAVR